MKILFKFRTPILLVVPIIVAAVWAFLVYITATGMSNMFFPYIWPMLIAVFVVYATGLYFWHKIEQTEYRTRLDSVEMEVNSLITRIEIMERSKS